MAVPKCLHFGTMRILSLALAQVLRVHEGVHRMMLNEESIWLSLHAAASGNDEGANRVVSDLGMDIDYRVVVFGLWSLQ